MGILSGFEKEKVYRNNSDGDKELISRWTNTETIDISENITSQEKTLANSTSWISTYDNDTTLPSSLDPLIEKLTGEFSNIKYLKNQCVNLSNQISNLAVVSKTKAGLCPQLPNETTKTKYLRQDGTWQVPPDTNTTYTFSNKAATLAWNTTSTIATVGGTNITVKLPAKPTFTDTWRPVVNNLTSTKTDESLSANMGRTLNSSITTLNSKVKTYVGSWSYVFNVSGSRFINFRFLTDRTGSNTNFIGDYPLVTDSQLRSDMGLPSGGELALSVSNGDAKAQPLTSIIGSYLKDGTWYVTMLKYASSSVSGSFRFNCIATRCQNT